jgi:hypothetical protein
LRQRFLARFDFGLRFFTFDFRLRFHIPLLFASPFNATFLRLHIRSTFASTFTSIFAFTFVSTLISQNASIFGAKFLDICMRLQICHLLIQAS